MKQNTAVVFDIQRFSLQNGPGIRTTVFVKGCGLRCWWCSNPESQLQNIQYMWDERICSGCGNCTAQSGCISPREYSGAIADKKPAACLRGALKRSGTIMCAEEVYKVVLADSAYYKRSGGGLTVSGGECLLSPDFTIDLLKKCKESNIHTTLDTSLYAAEESVAASMMYTDLYLADLKLADGSLHRQMTGHGNELIIKNLKTVLNGGKRVWIRIPLIYGVNDTITNAEKTAELISGYDNVEYVDILPAHSMSKEKYIQLGREWRCPTTPGNDTINAISNVFKATGLNTRIMKI